MRKKIDRQKQLEIYHKGIKREAYVAPSKNMLERVIAQAIYARDNIPCDEIKVEEKPVIRPGYGSKLYKVNAIEIRLKKMSEIKPIKFEGKKSNNFMQLAEEFGF